MQKKLIAIAVAGALAPAAAMAQSTVEIYGRANVGIDMWEAKGATAAGNDYKSRPRIFDVGSRLGFRVNESLGGGMRAFVVIESGANLDSGSNAGQSGGANASTGFWASRDSYAGIGGGWGDVRFGRQSPYYGNGIILQAGSNYINQAVDNWFSFGGFFGAPSGRESNVLSYNSPTMGGFNASLSYGVGASEGAAYTGGGTQKKEQVYAVTLRYTGGPIRAQFDYGTRQNVSNVADSDRNGWKVGAGWAYAPNSQLSFMYGEHEVKNNQTAVVGLGTVGTIIAAGESPKVPIMIFNWEHMMGQWQLIAQYARAEKLKNVANTADTEAQGYTLAAKYFLSKRTGVYLSYSAIDNKNRAFWDMSNAGFSSASSTALTAGNAGADPSVFALGVMHNF